MSSAEQVQVLGYVTQIAALVTQTRDQVKKLQERINELTEQGEDLQRRMLVSEAGIAVANATSSTEASTGSASAVIRDAPATQSGMSCARRPQYTIAAPSPHYVSLTGGPDPLYLGLGDIITLRQDPADPPGRREVAGAD